MGNVGNCLSITIRPYQILCAVCAMGEEDASEPRHAKIKELLETVMENPDVPITLRCNVGDVFAYQDPGIEEDTPEGCEFNRKRDLDVLQRLDLPPGITLPARMIFHRLWDTIESVSGICGYDEETSDTWRGCPKAKSGFYEKGRRKGIGVIVAPRSEEEMAAEKQKSLEAMFKADAIKIRPHILLCAVCQYSVDVRPPFKADNLPEMLQFILKHPKAKLQLVKGPDWMICAPCPDRVPKLEGCVCWQGRCSTFNELKDLNVLQKLGLRYGDTMNARKLYRLIFERIPSVIGVCALNNPPLGWIWLDPCGENISEAVRKYEKGREILMKEFGFEKSHKPYDLNGRRND